MNDYRDEERRTYTGTERRAQLIPLEQAIAIAKAAGKEGASLAFEELWNRLSLATGRFFLKKIAWALGFVLLGLLGWLIRVGKVTV